MKLSIITINRNNRDGLCRTIKSVVKQSIKDFEFIVIDGNSTDGSQELLRHYCANITFWISESDDGIYHAMNKGVKIATGEFCLFLNSGDWLYSNTVIEKIMPYLDNDVDLLSGFQWGVPFNRKNAFRMTAGSPYQLRLHVLLTNYLSHGSTFIRSELLSRRPYDESLKIVSDWRFFVESYAYDNIRYRHINLDISYFDITGISSVSSHVWDEGKSIRDSIVHPKLLDEIRFVPLDVSMMYSFMKPDSKIGKFSSWIINGLGFVYAILTGRIKEYNNLFKNSINIRKSFGCNRKEINFLYID